MEEQVVVFDKAVVGEAVVTVVADDDVIEDLDLDAPRGEDEVAGDVPVAERGLGIARGVVMGEDERRGLVAQGVPDHLPGIDGARVHRALEERPLLEDLVLGVEEDDLELLALEVPEGVGQVIEDLPRGMADGAAHHPVLEELPGRLVHELQTEDVPGPDAGDPLELPGRRLEDPPEGLELPERGAGRLLAVAAGRPQGQKKLDDLVVQEAGEAGPEEFFAEPGPVAGGVRPAANGDRVVGAHGGPYDRRAGAPIIFSPGKGRRSSPCTWPRQSCA